MRKVISLFVLILIEAGCATVYSRGPMATVESPEVASSDRWHMNINFSYAPVDRIKIIDSAASRPLVINTPSMLERDYSGFVGNSFNTPIPLEFGYTFDLLATFLGGGFGLNAMVKYQLIGPTYDKRTNNSHLFAIFSHATYSSQSSSGQQEYWLGPGGYPWSVNSHFKGTDVGASYGYRIDENWLVYTGAAFQTFNIDAEVNQSTASSGAAGTKYNFPETQGTNQKTSLGMVFGKELFKFDTQVGYFETKFQQKTLNEWCVALSGTFHFGGSKATSPAGTAPGAPPPAAVQPIPQSAPVPPASPAVSPGQEAPTLPKESGKE